MEVIISDSSKDASMRAARLIAKTVKEKPDAALGLATGGTPLELYRALIAMHKSDGLDFSKVRTFNLDEYIGLPETHEHSYHFFMHENFFKHVNVKPANIHIPNGLAKNVERFCFEYEAQIKAAGGIDVQVLGIGSDGHIGFNEPTSSMASRTRIKTLTPATIEDNARFFNGDKTLVPPHVITMGIGTIMDARTIVMLAFGSNKADAVAKMIEGPITAMVPASALQMHERTKCFTDLPAASKLGHAEYYKWVYSRKPDWQKDS